MAEDKAFEASASRIARAKREGDLPRSTDMNVVASVTCGGVVLFAVLSPLQRALRVALAQAVAPRAFSAWPYAAVGGCALAVCGAALLGALVGSFGQSRTLVVKFPAPKFEKLNPFAGMKKMFSRDAALGGAKALVVASAVGAASLGPARDVFAATTVASSPGALATLVVRGWQGMLASALVVAALFALGDLGLERAKWKKRLRMSFDELKRDHKSSDGDPLVRNRRRQAHRALVRGGIARVKDAAFVVTNPTHIAIALEYRPPDVAVPRVIVRAIDEGAREVKRRARDIGVPIVENVPLARALLAATDVGDCIPPGVYGAVATIVATLVREKAIA